MRREASSLSVQGVNPDVLSLIPLLRISSKEKFCVNKYTHYLNKYTLFATLVNSKEINMNKTALLAYSGGLDTSFSILWLQDQGYRVRAVTVNTGGYTSEQLEEIERSAIAMGAENFTAIDAVDQVYDQFGSWIIKGNILRGGVYPLVVGAERYLQAQVIADMAITLSVDAVVHGSTGAGNDQVRFDDVFHKMIPEIEIITPIRTLALSREEEIQYLRDKGHTYEEVKKTYSINQGIFGITIGGGETHDTWQEVPEHAYQITKHVDQVSTDPEEVIVEFSNGLPIALNGEQQSGRVILESLNSIGGDHGFGRGMHVGETIVGIKGRIAFEAPGLLALIKAHQELEKIVLTKSQLEWKGVISQFFGSALHEARWFDSVVDDWKAFIDSTQSSVNGEVRVKFNKGRCEITGCRSEYSRFTSTAQYGEGSSLWSGEQAAGFCKIYSMATGIGTHSEKSFD